MPKIIYDKRKVANEFLAKKLKAARVMSGIEVEEIAKALDLTPSRVYAKLRDVESLRMGEFRIIAELMNVSPANLLEDWR